jgi:hypothetical protein
MYPKIWDPGCFLYMDSEGGRIGHFRWINSNTETHPSWMYFGASIISWGGWWFGPPEPGVMLNGSDYLINEISTTSRAYHLHQRY